MTTDEKYIRRCIELASNGLCNAAPNPMVGAVIVHNGKIIGEGYHARCGEGHAWNHARTMGRHLHVPTLSSARVFHVLLWAV